MEKMSFLILIYNPSNQIIIQISNRNFRKTIQSLPSNPTFTLISIFSPERQEKAFQETQLLLLPLGSALSFPNILPLSSFPLSILTGLGFEGQRKRIIKGLPKKNHDPPVQTISYSSGHKNFIKKKPSLKARRENAPLSFHAFTSHILTTQRKTTFLRNIRPMLTPIVETHFGHPLPKIMLSYLSGNKKKKSLEEEWQEETRLIQLFGSSGIITGEVPSQNYSEMSTPNCGVSYNNFNHYTKRNFTPVLLDNFNILKFSNTFIKKKKKIQEKPKEPPAGRKETTNPRGFKKTLYLTSDSYLRLP
ncbi:hypothetical protein IEQ34_006825 [Dendrobium chrysotoxum]|uniref:Uncharacterized protein n=1 Tax=Dendrobium chrysotoxum TaxID=161865 RepID=A0AAV7GRG9_DENCH|nr:hypothetical protein IEQ34_006825 [Dendrobium chrysotoxum]